MIEENVKLYYGFESDPLFTDTIVPYQGFLEVDLCLPLSPLAISFFNYAQQASQKFIGP